MEKKEKLRRDFIKKLEWIKICLSDKNFLYFFPQSLTLIEHDEKFDSFLKDLKSIEKFEQIRPPLYPEDYIENNLYNIDLLLKENILQPLKSESETEKIPLKRIILANTLRCNMACKYCYNQFEFNRPSHSEKDMPVKTFQKLTEFLERNGKNIPLFELLFIAVKSVGIPL